jgi:hypothetical protein
MLRQGGLQDTFASTPKHTDTYTHNYTHMYITHANVIYLTHANPFYILANLLLIIKNRHKVI